MFSFAAHLSRTRLTRVGALKLLLGFAICASVTAAAALWRMPVKASQPGAPEPRSSTYFNIGSGSIAGTYFHIADLIAGRISHPLGSVRCAEAGTCGPEGLIVVARAGEGSVHNVRSVNAGMLESGLAQADIVNWAVEGTHLFKKAGAHTRLRAIANLYPESVHLIARKGAGIESIRDLKGKHVSVDRQGSGSHADADLLLEAFGLRNRTKKLHHIDPDLAATKIEDGSLDAFFYTAGAPVAAVDRLIASGKASLVPIDGQKVEDLHKRYQHIASAQIPAGTYGPHDAVPTVSVGAIWIVNESLDEDLVYQITRALWDERNLDILAQSHPLGAQMSAAGAVSGLPVPLHPGARRYYTETGHLPAEAVANDNEPAGESSAATDAAALSAGQ